MVVGLFRFGGLHKPGRREDGLRLIDALQNVARVPQFRPYPAPGRAFGVLGWKCGTHAKTAPQGAVGVKARVGTKPAAP